MTSSKYFVKKFQLKELCLEITNKCPLKCIHCSSTSSPHSKEELDFKLVKKIIDHFKNLGGKVLEISGGEPLLHKDIYKIIEHAKKKNLRVHLYTSGLKTDEKKLIDAGVDRFLFGVHGSKPNTHEQITKTRNSFSKTIRAIKNLKKIGANVGIHFTPMKTNYKEVKELCKKAKSMNVDEFAVLRFVPQGRGSKNKDLLKLNEKEVRQLLSTVRKLKNRHKFIRLGCPIDFSFFSGNENPSKCKIAKSTLAIRADGTVILCPALKYKKRIGNVKEYSLERLWKDSPVLNKIRENCKIEECKACKHFNQCKGKCLAQHLYNYGKIFKGKDLWCETAKKIYLR